MFTVYVVAASFVIVVGVAAASFVFVVGVGAASLVFAVRDISDPTSSFVCCLELLLGAAPSFYCRVDVMSSRGSP